MRRSRFDYVSLTLGKTVSAAAQTVLVLLLAMELEPGQLATLLAIYSLASVIAALGDFGLGTLGMREQAYGDPAKANRAVWLADRLALAMGATGLTVILGTSTVQPALLPAAPLILWAPIERATETKGLQLVAQGRVTQVAILTGGRRLAALAAFFVLSQWLPPSYAFSLSLASTALAAQAIMASWLPHSRGMRQLSSKALLRESLPFALTGLSGQLRNLDTPITAIWLPVPLAAAYGLGSRFASPLLIVFSASANVLLARARTLGSYRLGRFMLTLLSGGALLTTAMVVAAPLVALVLRYFIGWVTVDDARVMMWVASGYLFAGIGIVLGSLCVAHHLQAQLVRVNIATVTTSLALISLLSALTRNGEPPAIAALACYAGQAVVLSLVLKMETRMHED